MVPSPQRDSAARARQLQPRLEVLDGYGALAEIYVLDRKTQGLTDSAAEAEEEANQQPVSQIGCCLLHQHHFLRFKIGLHLVFTSTSQL